MMRFDGKKIKKKKKTFQPATGKIYLFKMTNGFHILFRLSPGYTFAGDFRFSDFYISKVKPTSGRCHDHHGLI